MSATQSPLTSAASSLEIHPDRQYGTAGEAPAVIDPEITSGNWADEVVVKEGDTTIQRGTLHRWRNESSDWVKIYYVMLGAKPIQIDGKILEQEFHPAE
ncbi:hypothetical protein C8R43DRAFT_1131485 [Mycena crocata]|nr:hypothetical protein C8R43DRAFT_1131485 [Mycena crocata]